MNDDLQVFRDSGMLLSKEDLRLPRRAMMMVGVVVFVPLVVIVAWLVINLLSTPAVPTYVYVGVP